MAYLPADLSPRTFSGVAPMNLSPQLGAPWAATVVPLPIAPMILPLAGAIPSLPQPSGCGGSIGYPH